MRRTARKSRWASWLETRIGDTPQNARPKTRAPLTKKRPYCRGNVSAACGMIAVLLYLRSIQRLVFPEIGDGKAERVDLNEVVAHRVTESEYNVSSVLRTFDGAAVERRSVDQFKLDSCLVRSCPQVLDVDPVNFDLLIGRGAGEEVVNRLFLGPGGQSVGCKLCVHEQQGTANIIANGQLVAAVIQTAKLGQEVFDFLFLRLVTEIVIFNGLCPPDGVNPDIPRMKAVDFFGSGISNVKRPAAE